jgi:hypothetical protein
VSNPSLPTLLDRQWLDLIDTRHVSPGGPIADVGGNSPLMPLDCDGLAILPSPLQAADDQPLAEVEMVRRDT